MIGDQLIGELIGRCVGNGLFLMLVVGVVMLLLGKKRRSRRSWLITSGIVFLFAFAMLAGAATDPTPGGVLERVAGLLGFVAFALVGMPGRKGPDGEAPKMLPRAGIGVLAGMVVAGAAGAAFIFGLAP